ncbi:MAG: hypothetical protein AAGF47_02085 [Planctomycetota bacterium]
MSTDRPLYVGYMPTPRRHLLALRAIVPLLLVLAAGIGILTAGTMNEPGAAVWDTSAVAEVEGVLRLRPVPHVVTPDGPVLLVEQGKFGAQERAAAFADRGVRVRGAAIERGAIRLIELAAGDGALAEAPAAAEVSGVPTASRRVRATGEIIDTKCFSGAMKPGEGRRHRACAILCIRGGIPAAFIGIDEAGEPIWGIIEPTDSGLPSESTIDRVGEPVAAEFDLTVRDGLPVISGLTVSPR